ncbi:cap-specific mRNA (nucleoside-2'-O-)-methyltransferase 1-like [Saccostrea cucullata]|uniref:cap-specific mRNA (nucleoside-2'-O-)-methyltransferase 1-like n=1 Tax=Saccostrea cuccullata TaxID=36930 RepID=UPI002ED1BC47
MKGEVSHTELPTDTLIEVEIVQEMKGEVSPTELPTDTLIEVEIVQEMKGEVSNIELPTDTLIEVEIVQEMKGEVSPTELPADTLIEVEIVQEMKGEVSPTELPTDTLIEVEIVQEMKGEGSGQRRMMTLHALDAMFMYGKDVRSLTFRDRIDKLRKFVQCITKPTRPNLTQIIVPYIYRLEEVHQVFDRLEFRRVKGSANPRLCYSPPDRADGRCFLPSGLCIVKIVKDPWTMALSKSANQKYFYNIHTKESTFHCPPSSVAHCSDCKTSSYIWKFEEGVKIHPDQTFSANPHRISKDNFLDYINMLTPR